MIGFYECAFDKRALMIYKSKTRSTGYFIRKKSWFYINQDIPKLSAHMKKKCLIDYRDNVRKKIVMLKKYETRKLRERADVNQILTIEMKDDGLSQAILGLAKQHVFI